MAGIYIHIPFCKSKCAYCNFFSQASEKSMNNFVEALLNEIDCRKDYIDDKEVKTIYFGGGTPSLLPVCFIDKILDRINKIYNVSSKAEISLEVNPDTVNRERLMDYKTLGINRISVGIQSFFDDDLGYLSRKHDSKHALQLIDDLKAVDFEKLNLDLIYGIPTQTEEKWNKNLDIFFSTGITHLSAYALTVEPKTILGQKIKNGILKNVSEEDAVNHYRILVRRAKEEGFEHYEISNFAKPSYRSQHNSIYWNDEPYLGFGPSAHSYNGVSRQWNVSNLSQYINYMGMSDEIVEKEILSIEDKYNEYVMTSLRTSWGCNVDRISEKYGDKYSRHFLKNIQEYLESGKIIQNKNNYFLTDEGMLFADGIAADLFF